MLEATRFCEEQNFAFGRLRCEHGNCGNEEQSKRSNEFLNHGCIFPHASAGLKIRSKHPTAVAFCGEPALRIASGDWHL
jgi:hypothetical protein